MADPDVERVIGPEGIALGAARAGWFNDQIAGGSTQPAPCSDPFVLTVDDDGPPVPIGP